MSTTTVRNNQSLLSLRDNRPQGDVVLMNSSMRLHFNRSLQMGFPPPLPKGTVAWGGYFTRSNLSRIRDQYFEDFRFEFKINRGSMAICHFFRSLPYSHNTQNKFFWVSQKAKMCSLFFIVQYINPCRFFSKYCPSKVEEFFSEYS